MEIELDNETQEEVELPKEVWATRENEEKAL